MADTGTITEKQAAFMEAQEMFFVATAPLRSDGHVNLSPKGLAGTFVVLDDATVAFLDTWGTGIETTAHVQENGRLCILFCSFGEEPRILRLHGQAEVITTEHHEFDTLLSRFPEMPGTRSIIRLRVRRISKSCGFGVPRYDFVEHRSELPNYAAEWGPERVAAFQRANNAESIDGLPGLLPEGT